MSLTVSYSQIKQQTLYVGDVTVFAALHLPPKLGKHAVKIEFPNLDDAQVTEVYAAIQTEANLKPEMRKIP